MLTNKLKSALVATAAGGTMVLALGTAPASAGTILGINLPNGGTLVAQVIDENLITATGQTLTGLGIINSITDNSLNTTYTYGQGGKYLTFTFTGFVSSFILPPTAGSAGYVEFAGGAVNAYVENAAPNLATGSQATDLTDASSGALFLGATPQLFGTNPTVVLAGGPATTDLEAVLPNNSTLYNFTNAFGSAFFDATSGPAAGAFHTCSLSGDASATVPCPAGLVDMTFTESFNTSVSGDFPVSGTGSLKANVRVPEPGTLSVFGVGLVMMGTWFRRRQRQA